MTTVLLVEDDASQSKRYERELNDERFMVLTATDGSEIVPLVMSRQIDVIVSDTSLDYTDGDMACAELLDLPEAESILIIGMSLVRGNAIHWEGIAHTFIPKKDITHLGTTVRRMYDAFVRSPHDQRYRRMG